MVPKIKKNQKLHSLNNCCFFMVLHTDNNYNYSYYLSIPAMSNKFYNTYLIYHRVPKKGSHQTFANNFLKS